MDERKRDGSGKVNDINIFQNIAVFFHIEVILLYKVFLFYMEPHG